MSIDNRDSRAWRGRALFPLALDASLEAEPRLFHGTFRAMMAMASTLTDDEVDAVFARALLYAQQLGQAARPARKITSRRPPVVASVGSARPERVVMASEARELQRWFDLPANGAQDDRD